MGVDFSQQGLSRMTCRLCTASDMPCSKFDSKVVHGMLHRGYRLAGSCGLRREIGAGSNHAPRSGARRAATKRGYPPTGVDGASPPRLCA
jgi:hypothetical protein